MNLLSEQVPNHEDTPIAEVAEKIVPAAAQKKVELIPYYLHVKQSDIQARLGNLAIEACRVLHKSLSTHSPKSPAFKKVADLFSQTPILMADFMQLEEAIDVARKTANKTLYGVEEPNVPQPVQDTTDNATGGADESRASDDSTERTPA